MTASSEPNEDMRVLWVRIPARLFLVLEVEKLKGRTKQEVVIEALRNFRNYSTDASESPQ